MGLNAFVAALIAGGVLTITHNGLKFNARCGGELLVGIAGGVFEFATAASAFDWVQAAVERRIAGNQKPQGVESFIEKIEGLRLKAIFSGDNIRADILQSEIDAMQGLGDVLFASGTGLSVASGIVLDGGGA